MGERERERRGSGRNRDKFKAVKVPRQCLLVLLVKEGQLV
jgi:hypothetical protein